jgi:ribulose-5-phosphate 4-epimerase/fuculose-1-phosphate aldolase
MNIAVISEDIVKLGKEITEKGLVNGTGGNISVRLGEIVVSTPSGWSLGELKAESLSVTNLNGEVLSGPKPTKELPMHLAVYHSRPDLHAVVHTHSINAVTYSCTAELNSLIPIYIPSIVIKVGNVKLIPFALPGSAELGELVGKEIQYFNGLLLENHGVLSTGRTLAQAGIGAYEIEDNLKIEFLSNHRARTISQDLIEKITFTYGG